MSTRAEVDAPWLGGVDRWVKAHPWVIDALLALTLAAVLGSLSISAAQGIAWPAGWSSAVVLAFVVLHLSVAVRLRAPAPAYAAASVAMLVIAVAPDGRVSRPAPGVLAAVPVLFLPSSLVFLLLLYSAAAHLPETLSRVALLVALVGAVPAVGQTADTVGPVAGHAWLVRLYVGLALGLTVLATWGLGRLAVIRRERGSTERAEGARLAVLEERARIAREMHDIVAHSLAVIVRQAEGGAFVASRAPEQAAQALQAIADTGRAALTDMRGVLGVLRDPGSGPATGPQPALADLSRLVAGVHDTGIDAELTEVGDAFEVGAATELAVYRLVQEGLTNAVKYAGPRARVEVTMQWRPTELTVEVTDSGGARGGQLPVPGAGAGLQGLHERVAAVGGSFRAARLAHGFRVQACFPRPAAGRTER